MNKQTITNTFKNVTKVLKKHSPEILTGIGIAGMVVAAVTAVKATPKALRLIDEKEIKDGKRLNNAEVFKTVWKCYIPAAVTGVCSIGCIIGASSINARRNAALTAAYAISVSDLKTYKEKALEVVGDKKEQAIRDAVAKEKIAKDPVVNKEIIMTGSDETLCYDVLSGRYFMSDIEKIRRAVNEVNRNMRTEMCVSLNDFYYEIGLPEIRLGNYLGWNIEKGYMEVMFSSDLAADGTPCLVVGYSSPPEYGYDS